MTHDGKKIKANQVPLSSSKRLQGMIDQQAEVIAIDEIQFFDMGIVSLCDNLANSGVRVIVAGLDLDFRGEPFPGPIQALMAKADRIDKLTAVCIECGESATRSQRLLNGEPAKWDDAVLVVGARDFYVAVCRNHYHMDLPDNAITPRAGISELERLATLQKDGHLTDEEFRAAKAELLGL
jgi:thymidine kinase